MHWSWNLGQGSKWESRTPTYQLPPPHFPGLAPRPPPFDSRSASPLRAPTWGVPASAPRSSRFGSRPLLPGCGQVLELYNQRRPLVTQGAPGALQNKSPARAVGEAWLQPWEAAPFPEHLPAAVPAGQAGPGASLDLATRADYGNKVVQLSFSATTLC